MNNVLTFVLAGGKGERLNPLTRDRAKPAVPFGGIYRIIDFTLSNCINSGLRRIFVLIQYKSFSLQRHLLGGWNIFPHELDEFIDVLPAQQRINYDWYKGTADAIYQNLYAIEDYDPNLVLILAGDHIYKMDYKKMIAHHQAMNADMTVACVQMPVDCADQFGVVEVDKSSAVYGFQEKPRKPKTIPGDASQIFVSMGIYLFSREVLSEELEQNATTNSEHDFGKNIIPQMIKKQRRVFSYNFIEDNGLPGYWRDIGTRDAYYESNLDLVKANPAFDLFDKHWPIRTFQKQQPPFKAVTASHDGERSPGHVVDSLISPGSTIEGGEVVRSIISPNVYVGRDALVENSILMDGVSVGQGAKIQNAIIDKRVIIPPNAKVGYDLKQEEKRFFVTKSGVVIVPKKSVIEVTGD